MLQVRIFGKGHAGPGKDLKFLLGGKGANLAEMSTIGLSVPPGLTITTEVCKAFNDHGRVLPKGVWDQCLQKLRIVEKDMNKKLGDPDTPLLLSVRSGAAMSMPGMMDTVLNLGLNDITAAAMEKSFGERFAMVGESILSACHIPSTMIFLPRSHRTDFCSINTSINLGFLPKILEYVR